MDKKGEDEAGKGSKWYNDRGKLIHVWIYLSVCFSVTHAAESTCIVIATATLGKQLGGISTGVLFFVYSFTALLGSTYLTYLAGPKWSIFTSLMLLVVYVGAFLIATYSEEAAWPAAIIGGFLGGIASAWLWTAQGLYFSRVAKQAVSITANQYVHKGSSLPENSVSKSHSIDKKLEDIDLSEGKYRGSQTELAAPDFTADKLEEKNNNNSGKTGDLEPWDEAKANSVLSGIFGGIYVSIEVVMKLLASALFLGGGTHLVFSVFTAAASIAAIATFWIPHPPPGILNDKKTISNSYGGNYRSLELFKSTLRLFYNDAVVRYLALFQINFAVALTFADFHLNAAIVIESLGEGSLGWLAGILSFTAAVSSPILSHIGVTRSGKRIGLIVGSILFGIVGLVSSIATEGQLISMGWGIVILYIMIGVGRGAFETTNKAVLVDFYPGDLATPAFSNNYAWSGFGFSFAFILFAYMSQLAMGVVLLLISLASIGGVIRAYQLTPTSIVGPKRSIDEAKADDVSNIGYPDIGSIEIGGKAVEV
ncbi:hypothetical protein AAMO2058_001097800 [Amorphochlora amoebiformis]